MNEEIEFLRQMFAYDANTGTLTNKSDGTVAGWKHGEGYLYVKVNHKKYFVHRLCWAIHHGKFPSGCIDHINQVKSDNRIGNLRAATWAENQQNRARLSSNTSGFKGVDRHRKSKKFRARINVNGNRIYLGCFKTPEEAHQAYEAAAIKLHGDFACVK